MKNYFKWFKQRISGRNLIMFLMILAAVIVMLIAIPAIQLETSIQSALPKSESLQRAAALTANSAVSNKLLLFIKADDLQQLNRLIEQTDQAIKQAQLSLNLSLPDENDMQQIIAYLEENALLLYPYEELENPFTAAGIESGLNKKLNYLQSTPFLSPGSSFFLDPLYQSGALFKLLQNSDYGRFTPYQKGMLAREQTAFVRIYDLAFAKEDYQQIKKLKKLDQKLQTLTASEGERLFLYCAHFYFLESYQNIQRDIYLIFALTIVLILGIYYFFYKNINLIFYSFMPIVCGISLTFLTIALLFKNFGAIALGFGAATAGIAIDYSIHYITKLNLYASRQKLRKNIKRSMWLGFITTILSFAFLPFSRIQSLQEIAFFGIVSISFCFLLAWFVLQNLIKPENTRLKIASFQLPAAGRPFNLVLIIICLVFLVLPFFIRLETDFSQLDQKHEQLQKRLSTLQHYFQQSTDNTFLVFESETKDQILKNSLAAFWILKRAGFKQTFIPPALFQPPAQQINERKDFIRKNFKSSLFLEQLNKTAFSDDSFNPWLEKIARLEQVRIEKLPPFLENEINNRLVHWNDQFYLLIHVNDRRLLEKMAAQLDQAGLTGFFSLDLLKDSARGLLLFEKQALQYLLLSIIIIFLLLFLFYKNIIFSLAAVLPAISGLSACFSLTVLLGIGFNIMHITAAILILGIGVDYGIFTASMYQQQVSGPEIRQTQQSILIAALTTLASFGVLCISRNQALFSLGSSMLIGITFSFLTANFLLPLLLKLKR